MKTKKNHFLVIWLYASVLMSTSLGAQQLDREVAHIIQSLDAKAYMKHLNYLASDELKGRGIGTEGYALAADYVAQEFKNMGLLPFGDSLSYFQQLKLTRPAIRKGSFTLSVVHNGHTAKGVYGKNISMILNPHSAPTQEVQQLVFVGYGNIVPEENINDYENLDVKGKIVIVALGGPDGITNAAFNDRQAKFNNAIKQGAKGLILFYPTAPLVQHIIFKRVHSFLSKKMLFLQNTHSNKEHSNEELDLTLFAKRNFVSDIFGLEQIRFKRVLRNMAKGYPVGKELKSRLRLEFDLEKETVISQNVIGMLPASNSNQTPEYVVLGSHLDGLGVGKAIKGDSIYNGMIDNASGVAGLLVIARSFTALSKKPKRPIIFICYTGEELGLLGSQHFLSSTRTTKRNIVASVNIDMLSQSFKTNDMAPLGYSHSNLSQAADFAAAALDISIDDNKEAERAYITRSDQFSFIKKGIPSLFIASGFDAKNPDIQGEKTFTKWMKKIYHSPFDDLRQTYDVEAFLNAIKFNFLTTYYISNHIDKVSWNKEGWLYKKFVLPVKNKLN